MHTSRLIQIIGFLTIVAFVVGGLGLRPSQTPEPAPDVTAGGPLSTTDAISYFARRVADTPSDAVSATILGEFHNQRARETGDVNEYSLALTSLELAIDRLPDYAPARLALATAHFGLHEFELALQEAEIATSIDPTTGALVVVADVAVATGDYETAAQIYDELAAEFESATLDARIAHLDELAGRYDTAIQTMAQAKQDALEQGIRGEALAWFDLRLGDLSFATGDYSGAEQRYREAIRSFERYPAAVAGLGRSLAAQGETDGALLEYERSIAMQPLPQTLLEAARLYESVGDLAMADAHRRTIEVIGELSGGVYDRALISHLIDVGAYADALTKAEGLAVGRRDTYTLDTLAWAQFNAGSVDAEQTIDKALAHGSADPVVLFHAGAIKAKSDPDRARTLLARALEISPRFDPLGAPSAADLLARLRS